MILKLTLLFNNKPILLSTASLAVYKVNNTTTVSINLKQSWEVKETIEEIEQQIKEGGIVNKSKEPNNDTFKLLKSVERFLLSRLGEVIQYDNWTMEFALIYLKETPSFLTGKAIVLDNLTEEELLSLGFKTWELATKEVLYLIPIWLKHILPTDLEVISISGTKTTLGECNNDIRQGCLAFGVK